MSRYVERFAQGVEAVLWGALIGVFAGALFWAYGMI